MRIEKLNGDKIKVTLTMADLNSLDIDIKQLAPDSKELHSFLFNIMETIKEETGFNPYTGQVVVEAMPSHEGMCLLVSKFGVSSKKITKSQFDKATSVRVKQKNPTPMEIFCFDNFDDLSSALKEIDNNSLLAGSLYKINDTYCFTIKSKAKFNMCINTMSEFSMKKASYPLQMAYVHEHGKLIAKGKELLNMADNIRQLT